MLYLSKYLNRLEVKVNKYNGIDIIISENKNVSTINFSSHNKHNRNKYKLFACNYYDIGRILCLLYLFQVNKISIDDIEYRNNSFIIYNYKKAIPVNKSIKLMRALDISDDILNSSVYKVDLLNDIELKSDGDILDIKSGFKDIYNYIIDNKFSTLNTINNTIINSNNLKIRDANIIDLERQLYFIDVYFNKRDSHEKRISRMLLMIENLELNFEEVKKDVDSLVDEGIFGYYNDKFEVTWISESYNRICKSDNLYENNIKISKILNRVGEYGDLKHYKILAEQVLNAINEYAK